jgi:hypothetical protein
LTELDEALERFQMCAMEYSGGLANHGPMAAEALLALRHPALIPGLVDIYAARLPDFEPGEPMRRDIALAALGEATREGDWVATFEAELAAEPWRDVVGRWLPSLIPGLFAAALHGLLRTAHAIRALERHAAEGGKARGTVLRLRELAFGLAYWASRFQTLPGQPGTSPEPGCGPAEVLDAIPAARSKSDGAMLFSDVVQVLDGDEAFAAALARLDLGALSASDFVSELCTKVAELYLAHPESRIAYAHALTGPHALRTLLPLLDDWLQPKALAAVLQSAAAMHACFQQEGATPPEPDEELQRVAADEAEARYRAAISLEEHAIKLTAACLEENAIRPDPLLRMAAADASLRIGQSRGSRGG